MFLQPLFLLAAAAGACIPLMLHLLQKKKAVPQFFPTLRFLKMADQQSSRRRRMENLLLWLLRTLIMALIGLAFAMPMLRTRGFGLFGRTARDVAIVLDASYSMRYQAGRQTIWDQAVEAAAEIIRGLDANDRIALFLAGEHPVALMAEPVNDPERALTHLEQAKPGYDTSCLAAALTVARTALKQGERRERELHILTDNQALAWKGFEQPAPAARTNDSPSEAEPEPSAGRPVAWEADALDRQTAVFATLLGVRAPINVTPLDLTLTPPLVFADVPAQLSAWIGCSGEAGDTTVSLRVAGREAARRAVRADPRRPVEAAFRLPPLPAGVYPACVATPEDNLPMDNEFHFLIRVIDQLPALCVGPDRDTLFLRTALRAGGGGAAPPWLTPDRLAADTPYGEYACVFLAGALPLSGQVVAGLTAYAADGGLLVFFPRSGGSLEEYRAWDCLPGIPTGVAALSGADSRRMLTWDAPQHPLLRPLRDSLAMPQISLQRCLTWETLHPQAVRLISAGASTPLLLQRDYGRGSVLMFSVSADRSWSSLPLSPFYLPLVMQILEHSGRVGAQAPFVWCADSVPMNGLVRHLEAEGALLDPDGRPVPVRSVAGAGREAAPAATLHIPGIYRLQAADGAGEPAPLVAANAPREESDLTPLEPGRLAQLLGVDALYTATDLETLQQAIREHRVGRTYGEHLLLLALLLIGVECLYANRLSRQTPGLTHRLGLTRSGRISGKRLAAAEPASREAAS